MAVREITQLTEMVSYLPSASNVGLWEGPAGPVLVDSGNDADTGRRILRSVEAAGRALSAIFLTHSNSDHMGGAGFISSRTGVPVYASRIEASLCADPILEPISVWGGYPAKELRGKFFVAPSCSATPLVDGAPPPAELSGADILPLPGHYYGQLGLLAGGVLFAGDALFGPELIEKHPVFFMYDAAAFFESLDRILSAAPAIALPSHGRPTEDVASLVAVNRAAAERVASSAAEACSGGASFEDVLAAVCDRFSIRLDWAQYALVGSTVRSYLVYLRERGILEAEFSSGRMIWRKK